MKIIEALKELPLIEKKITKNLGLIQEYSSNLQRGDDTDLPFETVEKQQREVDALLQSNGDLVRRKGRLRRALAVTNANVSVTINGMEATIVEWIEYREKGMEYLIATQKALSDRTSQNLINKTPVDLQKGVRTLRFYNEANRNFAIAALEEIKDQIDAQLEIVNATTDLTEKV